MASGMTRRRFLLASLSGVGAVTLGSCRRGQGSGAGGGSGRTVRLNQGAFGFPSPFGANADFGYNQMSLLYDTLLWKDGGGQLLPWLASRVSASPDHLTYTFELRDGLKWSDGRPLTSDDVAFTFEYYGRQRALPPPVIIQPPQGIARVQPMDARTVAITLSEPVVTFPEQVAGALPIIPRHVWSSIGDPAGVDDVKMLVGSGAYRLESYDGDGSPMRFVAKDDYFLGSPYMRRIDQYAIEDPFAALLAGATDHASGEGLRPDILAPYEGDDRFGVVTERGSSAHVLFFNLGREGPLADPMFRRACAMAIDRRDLVNRLASGKGLPGNPGFLSPTNPFFAPVPQYDFDVAGASSLLDAAGYRYGGGGVRHAPGRGPLELELLYNATQPPLAETLVAALRRVGIQLKTKPVPIGPQLFGNKLLGNYDMAVLLFPGPGAGGPNADPDVLRRLFSSKVRPSLQGATAFANPSFDELAEKQQVTFDEAERKAIVADMQTILAEEVPALPLYYPEMAIAFRRQVLDQWYFTPGQFPTLLDNKQLFITGLRTGTAIRPR